MILAHFLLKVFYWQNYFKTSLNFADIEPLSTRIIDSCIPDRNFREPDRG